MLTITMGQGLHVRRIGLAVAFGLLLALSGCSDDKGTETPAPPKAVSQPDAAPAPAGPPQGQTAPPATTVGEGGPCTSLMNAKCIECHSMARVCEKIGKKSKNRWQRTIDRMVDRGAKMTPDERAAILDCLENGVTNDLQGVCR